MPPNDPNDPNDEDEEGSKEKPTGAPSLPRRTNTQPDPALKPMTGAQFAFRPSTPPRAQKPATGTQPAFKPATGTHPALRPGTGTHAAFKPGSAQPASVSRSSTGTNTFAAFKPAVETEPLEEEDVPPVFDAERLQVQIRAMSLTDSALGRVMKPQKQPKAPTTSADDTFVKTKMKQAEAKVPDFDLDEDLG